jgi:hypothetical protein
MSKFVQQATGASEDQSSAFLEQLTQQEKLSMTFKSMQSLFDKWHEKNILLQKEKQMTAVVEGTVEKEKAVEEHKTDLTNITDPNKKTGKDMMVKVQDAMVQADDGDEINFAPKGFFNGFTNITAKVYDQLTSLYTAVATMKDQPKSEPKSDAAYMHDMLEQAGALRSQQLGDGLAGLSTSVQKFTKSETEGSKYTKDIMFEPEGGGQGSWIHKAEVVDALGNIKVEDFIMPMMQAVHAEPTPTTDVAASSKTVDAINNLTAAIADKPIVVEVDGREVTRAFYNQTMKSG